MAFYGAGSVTTHSSSSCGDSGHQAAPVNHWICKSGTFMMQLRPSPRLFLPLPVGLLLPDEAESLFSEIISCSIGLWKKPQQVQACNYSEGSCYFYRTFLFAYSYWDCSPCKAELENNCWPKIQGTCKKNINFSISTSTPQVSSGDVHFCYQAIYNHHFDVSLYKNGAPVYGVFLVAVLKLT